MKEGVSYERFREMMLSFPEVKEGTAYGSPIFKVKNKMAARLSEEFADTIVIKVNLALRSSLLEAETETFYITPHYAAHPLILVKLSKITFADLKYLIEQAWRIAASKTLVKSFDAGKIKESS